MVRVGMWFKLTGNRLMDRLNLLVVQLFREEAYCFYSQLKYNDPHQFVATAQDH